MRRFILIWLWMARICCHGETFLGKNELRESTVVEFYVPLSAAIRAQFIQLGQSTVTVAHVGIFLPAGFVTNDPNHFVLINSTTGGRSSSVGSLKSFAPLFGTNNCLGIAADGPGGPIPGDPLLWRYGLEKCALDYVRAAWPQSQKWPIICGGFSGGAKWSPLIAGLLVRDKYSVEGIFMGGCNEDKVTETKNRNSLGVAFLKTPLFLCGGENDPIATPDQQWGVYDSLKKSGFTRVQYQTYPGGHTLVKGPFHKALGWFMSGAITTPPPPGRVLDSGSTNDLKIPKTLRLK
jgi:hypothetical protein